jgi:magnesium chelatase subunit I
MEERDVQIKGYKIRLPIDVVIMASANPEDYTSRGRIITPLKDRFDVQIRTHYPDSVEDEIAIMEQERDPIVDDALALRVPDFMKKIIAEITMEARRSGDINQSSGVSVRVSINNYEAVISNAEKRAVRRGEKEIVPRVSDLHAIFPSTGGKIELEYMGEDRRDNEIIQRLVNRALQKIFDEHFKVGALQKIIDYFASGGGVEVSDEMASEDYMEGIHGIPGLKEAIHSKWDHEEPPMLASEIEFILEGLHLHQKLNKEVAGGRWTFKKV